LDFGHTPGSQPVSDTNNLDQVRLYTTFWKDEAEVLDHRLFTGALLHFKVERVLMEDVKGSYYDLMMSFFSLTAKNEDVVHVDDHYPLINEIFEDVIHHCLEGGRAVH